MGKDTEGRGQLMFERKGYVKGNKVSHRSFTSFFPESSSTASVLSLTKDDDSLLAREGRGWTVSEFW